MSDQIGKIWFASGMDNSGLRRDGEEAKKIFSSVTDNARAEGERLDKVWGKLAKTMTGALAGISIGGFVQKMFEVRSAFQDAESAMTLFLGSAEKSKSFMKDLQGYAWNNAFEFSDLVDQSKQLLAYGADVESVIPTIDKLSNVAIATKQPLSSLIDLYNKAKNIGSIDAIGLKQWAAAGLVVTDVLKEMGVQTDSSKVSFDQMEKALNKVTAEGGRFHKQMETMMPNLSMSFGQLQDDIANMFNELGQKSEGIMKGAIEVASLLVDNYEKVGKTLVGIIATYGAYRASVMLNVAAESGWTISQLAHYKALLLIEKAQKLLNATMLKNPLVLMATLAVGLASAMWALRDSTTAAEKAQERYNKLKEEAAKKEEEHKNKITELIDAVTNQYLADQLRVGALEELIKKYPSVFSQYDIETLKLADILNLKKQIAEIDAEEKRQETADDYQKYLSRYEGRKYQVDTFWATGRPRTGHNLIELSRLKKDMEAAYQDLILYGKDFAESEINIFISTIPRLANDSIASSIPTIEKELEKMESLGLEYSDKFKGIFGEMVSAEQLESLLRSFKNEHSKRTTAPQTFDNLVMEARQAVESVNTELQKLKTGEVIKATAAEQAQAISDAEKNLNDAKSRLNTLLGVDPKKSASDNDKLKKAQDDYNDAVLKAHDKLASEETAIERQRITDKLELIEFDRRQTIAAIEKEKEAYLNLAEAAGFSRNKVDISVFEKRINSANDVAQYDNKKELADQIKSEMASWDEYYRKYGDFQQKKLAITIEYANKIAEAQNGAEVAIFEEERDEALRELSQSMVEESDLWIRLFEDASKKTVSEIEGIITETQNLLDYLQGIEGAKIPIGFTDEQLSSLKLSPEIIKKIQEAIKNLKGEVASKSPFKAFANDIENALKDIKSGDIGKGLQGIGSAVSAISPHVRKFGDDLSTIFGDSSIAENINIAMTSLEGLTTTAGGVGKIMSGDILGGAQDILSGIASIFSMANEAAKRHREALERVMADKISQQREYNLLLLEQNLLYEQGTTIFGTDNYGAAKNAVDNYYKSIKQLNEELAGTEKQQKNLAFNSLFNKILGNKDANADLKKLYAGLADIEIITGHKKTGLFGWGKGKDIYSSVFDVYPELINANGNFNKSLAETILSTRKMDDTSKDALQNMINLAERYEEALEQVKDYLTDIFGELGNTMSDTLVDAFRNGTDAAMAFTESVSAMLETLAKDMVYSVTLAPLLEQAQEDMLAVMKNTGLSDEQKFKQYTNILSDLTDNALYEQENANALYEAYKQLAAAKGMNIFQPDADNTSRTATAKGIATASQDSVDENNGRLTVIQAHTYSMNESLRTANEITSGILDGLNMLRSNSAQMLEHVAGIKEDTAHLKELNGIRDDIGRMRASLDSINTRGVTKREI